ncbi:related to signal recognition particle protein Sec65 [Cephalotrichum gorgonifer]|uniref:Related to signal recognition particle protein Sec65 n=1 Tax=Cephalotrichum gorgonifer TaxID=2041049 RepID=A0AAE8N3M8_9PEZI|nr:related to signal recognition particle protein Sec65 [Cephalotrichum gorgonifer]
MSHPRIEEVSDSDPSEGDISDFDEADIMMANTPAATKPATAPSIPHLAQQFRPPASGPPGGGPPGGPKTFYTSAQDAKQYADFSCLYPIYFSALHTRQEGRRVSKDLAVKNPLARDLAHACSQLGLQVLFEPGKSHPRDWSNPGRVRVRLQGPPHPIKNRHHLFRVVAAWMKEHPTTEESPSLRFDIPGVPMPKQGEPWPKPAVPKGWKMGDLLPFVSPAMTGGGVSEDLFKDMMREMAGGGDPMAALMGGAGRGAAGAVEETGKKKKDKKGKGKA